MHVIPFALRGGLVLVTCCLLLSGCATQKIDWSLRIGVYDYEQAVLDFGPPDKQEKLSDGTMVAEWLTQRGYTYISGGGYWGYPYRYWGPPYPAYATTTPDYYLRLIFGADGKLKGWRSYAK